MTPTNKHLDSTTMGNLQTQPTYTDILRETQQDGHEAQECCIKSKFFEE